MFEPFARGYNGFGREWLAVAKDESSVDSRSPFILRYKEKLVIKESDQRLAVRARGYKNRPHVRVRLAAGKRRRDFP